MFQKDDGGGINESIGVSGSGNEVFKALSNFANNNFLPLGKVAWSLVPFDWNDFYSVCLSCFYSFPVPNSQYAALVTSVAAGIANPSLGCLADKYYLSKFSTFGIFVISG